MVRFIVVSCFTLFSACSFAAGINLSCDEYTAVVEPDGLTVNGHRYTNPQEKPFDLSDDYTGRSLIYTDSQDQNNQSNWVAINIITQISSGKKAFFFSNSKHTDDKAIICTRKDAGQ